MYNILPPPRAEIEEAIVMFYTGPKKPNAEHFRKLPLVVRPSVVRNALNWLRLNHSEYMDLGPPSEENLKTYPEDMPPLSLHYKENTSDTNITIDPSVHENKDTQGTDIEEDECAFIIHGLVGTQLDTMTYGAKKAAAMDWYDNRKGSVLAIHRKEAAESIYHNLALYPLMF
ncbi:hypothetical protein BDZ89DRAFT_953747, partial [Hymenopellis radicata]